MIELPERRGMTEDEIALAEHGIDPQIASPDSKMDMIKATMERMDAAVAESACPVCAVLKEKLNAAMVEALKSAKDFDTAKVIVGLADYRDGLLSTIAKRCKELQEEKLKAKEKEVKSSE